MNLQTMPWIVPRSVVVPLAAFGILAGALVGSAAPVLPVLLFVSLVVLALCTLALVRRQSLGVLLVALIFSAALLLGVARSFTFYSSLPSDLAPLVGQRAVLSGVVVAAPDARETSTRLTVRVEMVNDRALRAKVLVSTNPYDAFSYGDVVRVSGVVEEPEAFETESGRNFNYRGYLRSHRITHTVSFAEVGVVSSGAGNPLIARLYSFKDALVARIDALLPDPEAPLLAGLLLGERQSLGRELYESLQRAGVVHMVVLSGYNVSLVAQAMLKVTEVALPPGARALVAGVGIVAFALMTGATETTVRASFMALILLVATVLRRPHIALRALLLAAVAMVLVNPALILYDLSFQLSVLATAGIILFADPIADRLRFLPTRFGLRDIGGATIAAQLAVLPLLVVSIGDVSLVSPVANLAVLGAVPYAMFFGFVASMVAFLSPLLAFPVALVAHGVLSYILSVSVWFGNLPLASVTVPPHAVAGVLIVLALLYGAGALALSERARVLKLPRRLGS